MREYRTSLKAEDQVQGELRIAVRDPNLLSTGLDVARVAPWGILAPLAFVGLGGFLLRRMVRAAVDHRDPVAGDRGGEDFAPDRLQPVPVSNAATLGWNRVVQKLVQGGGSSDLQDRLADAVASRRQDQLQDTLDALSDGLAVTDAEGESRLPIEPSRRCWPSTTRTTRSWAGGWSNWCSTTPTRPATIR